MSIHQLRMLINAQKAQEVYLEKGTTMTNINLTDAIRSGKIDFEQACQLEKMTITEAIRAEILTFEQACQLTDMAVEVAETPKAKAPKAPKAPKPKKAKAPKAEERPENPKAEEPEAKEPVYTKGGCILQWGDEIAAKGTEKAAITKAYNALKEQGFSVERKRCGTWVQIYQAKENKRPAKEFAAAKLDKGWTLIKGAWTYVDLLKGYEDCFRPEK